LINCGLPDTMSNTADRSFAKKKQRFCIRLAHRALVLARQRFG